MVSREDILNELNNMKAQNCALASGLTDRTELTAYSGLIRIESELEIWSDALQRALDEHEVVKIPARHTPYYIDRQIIIGSNRRIEAEGATIILMSDCKLLMLRNSSAANGTHAPIHKKERDCNISIIGGRWEESLRARAGYGSSGKFDSERSFYGVSTLFFFNNMDNLTLEGVTFAHTGGFAVQIGDISCAAFEKIRFSECYADGIHVNGNTAKLLCRDIKGQVGDDLVALNAYDWQNSSVDFGPISTVLVDDLELSSASCYKAMRILPGRYYYDNGTDVDCSISDAIIRNIRGVKTFKLYYQTPPYRIGEAPERGGAGSADNIFFENIPVELDEPVDLLPEYVDSDPVKGIFAAFEFGADIGKVTLENIDFHTDTRKYPLARLAAIGPKSSVSGDFEIFDPYVSSRLDRLCLKAIRINGEPANGFEDCILDEICFDNINNDGNSTGSGTFGEVLLDGRKIK